MHLTDYPSNEDRAFLHERIREFNNTTSPHHKAARQPGAIVPLAVLRRDEDGNITAGLVGDTYWHCLEIDDFWVHPDLRGQGVGSRILEIAEAEAQRRGCAYAHLKTFSFQAESFYAKHGYRVIGRLEDYPPGHSFVWMRKDF